MFFFLISTFCGGWVWSQNSSMLKIQAWLERLLNTHNTQKHFQKGKKKKKRERKRKREGQEQRRKGQRKKEKKSKWTNEMCI